MPLNPSAPEIHSWLQLVQTVRRSGDKSLGIRDALFTADQLIRHGCHGPALRVIGSLVAANRRNETFQLRLEKLAAAAEQLRRIPNLKSPFFNPVQSEKLLSFGSVLLKRSEAPRSLMVVYATGYNNFDISFPFLHCLIAERADAVLYVKNPALGMYTTGNHEFGRSIDAMSTKLARIVERMSPAKVTVLGFSGGGYAALHMAATAGADRFLGFGIKTDWSVDSPFRIVAGRASPAASDRSRNTLVNLRSLEAMRAIGRACLVFGDKDGSIQEHALNMGGLDNCVLHPVARGSHNIIMDLLERGELLTVLGDAC